MFKNKDYFNKNTKLINFHDIQSNSISYESLSKSRRAFEIRHHKGCIFIGNQVTNSFHKDSSGVKYLYQSFSFDCCRMYFLKLPR